MRCKSSYLIGPLARLTLQREDDPLELAFYRRVGIQEAEAQTWGGNGVVLAVYHLTLADRDQLSIKIELSPAAHIQLDLRETLPLFYAFRRSPFQQRAHAA